MQIKSFPASLAMLLCLFAGCAQSSFNVALRHTETTDNYVIILHGLRGGSNDFQKMEKALLNAGYNVCRVDYPSTKYTIPVLADSAIAAAITRCQDAGGDTLFFVAHSMGAILLRYYLQEHPVPALARAVLISPPNHGTELVDKFGWCPWFRKFNGPGGMQLSAGEDGLVHSLASPEHKVGVIMSTQSINPIESLFIPGKDDGRVSIASARLDGADFVLVNSNHHFCMRREETIRQVIHFLKNGRFAKTP